MDEALVDTTVVATMSAQEIVITVWLTRALQIFLNNYLNCDLLNGGFVAAGYWIAGCWIAGCWIAGSCFGLCKDGASKK